jgi:hypothetical protein
MSTSPKSAQAITKLRGDAGDLGAGVPGVEEANFAVSELGAVEGDPAAGEMSAAKAELAAGEPGKEEADVDVAAEPCVNEVDQACREPGSGKVKAEHADEFADVLTGRPPPGHGAAS